MTAAKKPSRKKLDQEKVVVPEAQEGPWLYNIPIKHAVTLKEPTDTEIGLGLFFLEDGSVRWSTVTRTPPAEGNE
jgi:hypothetical protein